MAFVAGPFCGLLLCWLTYSIQARFNRVPLFNGLYDFTYLFSFPVGVLIGVVATWICWWFKWRGVRVIALIAGALILMIGLAAFSFNPITDPNDPSFGMEHFTDPQESHST